MESIDLRKTHYRLCEVVCSDGMYDTSFVASEKCFMNAGAAIDAAKEENDSSGIDIVVMECRPFASVRRVKQKVLFHAEKK
jgi:hypothetical protein